MTDRTRRLDATCLECRLYEKGARCPNMLPSGSTDPIVYFLGTAPAHEDDKKDVQFAGRAGKTLKRAMRTAGIPEHLARYYNVVNCLPPKGLVTQRELDLCSTRARSDILGHPPAVIVALGNEAMQGLWPNMYDKAKAVTKVRGSWVPYKYGPEDHQWAVVVPTYTPGYVDRGITDDMTATWIQDIADAYDIAGSIDEPDIYPAWQRLETLNAEPNYIFCRQWSKVKECFSRLKDEPVVTWDYETSKLKPWAHAFDEKQRPPHIYSVAFGYENGDVYGIPIYADKWWANQKYTDTILESIGKWLLEHGDGQVRIAHNLKFEMLWSYVHCIAKAMGQPWQEVINVDLPGIYQDTFLQQWIMDERRGMNNLKVASWAWLGTDDWAIDVKDILGLHERGQGPDIIRYNMEDTWNTSRLHKVIHPHIQKNEAFNRLYNGLLLPGTWAFLRTQLRGIPINEEHRQELIVQFEGQISNLLIEIQDECGISDLNPGSPEQLSNYFTNECGYRMLKKTKKAWSVDKESLEYVVSTYNDKVAALVMDYKSLIKVNGTYVRGLDKLIMEDGRIHPNYNIALTVTGRTSSDDPNIQNFPKRNKKQKVIRRFVVPPEDHKIFSFDYGQIEARLFGVVTADKAFVDALWHDMDIHTENAKIIFDTDTPTGDQRTATKMGTFGLLYGGGPPTVSAQVGTTVEKIAKLRKILFQKYPGLKAWQKEELKFEAKHGYIENLFGRRRRAPMEYSEKLNTKIQGTASDMTAVSKVALHKKYDCSWMIHDDLSFFMRLLESTEDDLLFIATTMLTVPWVFMQYSPWVKEWVPMQVEAEVGDNWCDMQGLFTVTSLDIGVRSMEDSVDVGKMCLEELGVTLPQVHEFLKAA